MLFEPQYLHGRVGVHCWLLASMGKMHLLQLYKLSGIFSQFVSKYERSVNYSKWVAVN